MTLRRSLADGVLELVLDRPDQRNAMTPELRATLTEEFRRTSGDPAVRAILVSGAGGSFCAGADIGGPPVTDRAPGDLQRQVREGVQALVAAVLDCEKPVVAAVDGVAAGIGAHLAFACDLVVVGESATFIEAFVRRGLVADGGGAWLLTRLVGLRAAKRLLLLGETVTAEQAERLGLVDQVVADAAVMTEARRVANQLAGAPTLAIGAMKRMANLALDQDREQAFVLEAELVERVRGSVDAREGLEAFRDRRPPRFTGC